MPEPFRKFAEIGRVEFAKSRFSAWLFGYFSDVSTVTTVSLPLYPNFLVVSIYILLFQLSPSLSFFFLSVSVHLVITDFLVVSISILLFCLSLSLSSYPVLLGQFSVKSQLKTFDELGENQDLTNSPACQMYRRDIHKMIRRVERGASGVETHCKPFLLVICRGSLCFSVEGLYIYMDIYI